jgi:hypothetical protein
MRYSPELLVAAGFNPGFIPGLQVWNLNSGEKVLEFKDHFFTYRKTWYESICLSRFSR